MKQFVKVVVWLVVLGAVCFGIYTILPEYPHNFIKSFVQPIVDSRAKELIGQVQNLTNKDINDACYKDILEANTGISCWVYETREDAPGVEYVIYQGSGASVNLKEFSEYNGKLSTRCQIKFEFKVTGNNVEICPYIDGVKMSIEDGKHSEENKKIRNSILQQLYGGIHEE